MPGTAVDAAATERASTLCWLCWKCKRWQPRLLCSPCLAYGRRAAYRMCAGKVRLGRDAAIDRAGSFYLTYGDEQEPYQCVVCDWWHLGKPGLREYRKRETLYASMYMVGLSPARLFAMRQACER